MASDQTCCEISFLQDETFFLPRRTFCTSNYIDYCALQLRIAAPDGVDPESDPTFKKKKKTGSDSRKNRIHNVELLFLLFRYNCQIILGMVTGPDGVGTDPDPTLNLVLMGC